MSEYLKTAIVTATTPFDDAIKILFDNIELLATKYQFGFRNGYGGVEILEFQGGEHENTRPIDTTSSDSPVDAIDIDSLLNRHRWIQLVGTMRFPGAIRLYDVAAGIRPGLGENGAMVYTHLDASIYNDVWPIDWDAPPVDDVPIDPDAAERLRALAVSLGAHSLTDGFCTPNVESVGDLFAFDGELLKDSFINPPSIAEMWANRHQKALRHGFVFAIKPDLCSLDFMRDKYNSPSFDVSETITGHIVINSLFDDDPSLMEDLDD